MKPSKPGPVSEASQQGKQKEDSQNKGNPYPGVSNKPPSSWQPGLPFGINVVKKSRDNNQSVAQGVDIAKTPQSSHEAGSGSMRSDKMMPPGQYSLTSATAQEQLKGPGNQGGGKGPDHTAINKRGIREMATLCGVKLPRIHMLYDISRRNLLCPASCYERENGNPVRRKLEYRTI
ncbi:hypothetical protein AKJ16_DCAP25359 [Drosera capensis]